MKKEIEKNHHSERHVSEEVDNNFKRNEKNIEEKRKPHPRRKEHLKKSLTIPMFQEVN